ncbi:MAG: alpha/beta hydrolase [Lachnospiraceae bacterium]|nr:alpha/beta hydrolase [Lachnospiraceae bacterium]
MKEKIYLESNGNILYGILEGPDPEVGKSPLVIIMHGYMEHTRMHPFYDLVRALWSEGFRTLRFDFNGHGRSEGELKDMTVSKDIIDAECYYNYAKELDCVSEIIPLGFSLGGVVASRLAVAHPEVQRFVLLSPAADLQTRAAAGTLFGLTFDPDNFPEILTNGDVQVGRGYIEEARGFDVFNFLKEYDGKVLLVYGEADAQVPKTQTLKYCDVIRNLTVVPVPEAGHLWEVNSDIAVEAIRKFLIKTNDAGTQEEA